MPPESSDGPRVAVDAEAEEGLLLAEYATRMRLKNRIIVETWTGSGGIDTGAWAEEVRLSLGRLRIEAEQSARRMERERRWAERTEGQATHEHDYRRQDAPILERRRRVYQALARRLLLWEADPERVAVLLDSARADALTELRMAVRERATGGSRGRRDEDPAVLQERLRMIAEVDLPALAAGVRGRQGGADRDDTVNGTSEPPEGTPVE
jgi:hypothetical protein